MRAYSAAIAISRKVTKIAAVPNVISEPIAVASRPSSSPAQATSVVADDAADRRLTAIHDRAGTSSRAARRRAPSSRSRGTCRPAPPSAGDEGDEHDEGERLARPVAEGRDDRRGDRVEVVAGDDRRRVRVRERGGERVEDHERAHAQQRDPHRARHVLGRALGLLRRRDRRVEADERPAADGERGQQCREVPPLSASAPNVSVSTPKPCSRKTSSSARPMPTDAIELCSDARPQRALSASTPTR